MPSGALLVLLILKILSHGLFQNVSSLTFFKSEMIKLLTFVCAQNFDLSARILFVEGNQ